ncbi:MAG: TolC family outer membrane protein [Gammaproteobacteria bacterium]
MNRCSPPTAYALGLALLTAFPTAFGAQNLLTTYEQAAASDPELRAAQASLQATRQNRPQARAALLPQISGSANITHNDTDNSGSFDSHGYSVSLSQSIYSYKNYASLHQVDAAIEQAVAEYDSTEQNLITRVASAYFDVLRAVDDLDFAVAEKKAISRQLEQATKRYEVGLIAITDVHEAQARYDLAVATEITAQNAVDSARAALRQITGVAPDALAPLGDGLALTRPEPAQLDHWTNIALDGNLSVKALEAAVEAARKSIEVEKADYLPSVALVGSHSYSDSNGGLRPGNSTDNSIGVQLTVPIYEGGLRGAQVSQAEYNLVAAEENYEKQRREVVRGTTDAYRGVLANVARVKALKQALVSNESALKATQAGFNVGTRTIVDVLNAQSNLHSAERDYKGSRYDYVLSLLQLKQATGSLSIDDIKTVNGWLE